MNYRKGESIVVQVIGLGNNAVLGHSEASGLAVIPVQGAHHLILGNALGIDDCDRGGVDGALAGFDTEGHITGQVIFVLNQLSIRLGAELVHHAEFSGELVAGDSLGPPGRGNCLHHIATVFSLIGDEHVAGIKQIL